MIIEDIVSEIILPNIRGILAHELKSRGLSQHRIASILNITQPLVHKLLKKPLEDYLSKLEKHGLDQSIVLHYCKILAEIAVNNQYSRFVITSHGFTAHMAAIIACREYQELREDCARGLLKDPHVEIYKIILSRYVSKPGLAKLLPEVGSNLVYAPEPPSSEAGVIGLTGRITKTLTGIVVTGEPFYGGSRHLSRLLLIISKYNSSKKIGFNVKYDRAILSRLETLNLRVEETGPHSNLDSFWVAMENAALKKPDVIADRGGTGLEPVIYLFTADFNELENIIDLLLQ
ncbi:MAG: thiamine-phosphate synthase family protein [Thermosphaera sp.]